MPFIEQGIIPDFKKVRFVAFRDGAIAYDESAKSHEGVALKVNRSQEFNMTGVPDAGSLVRNEVGNFVEDLSGGAAYLHPETGEILDAYMLSRDLLLLMHRNTAVRLTELTGTLWQARI